MPCRQGIDSVEFEATIAQAYLDVVRVGITALEPRDRPTPDFEVDMGRPVAIEAKARASTTSQDERMDRAFELVQRELGAELDRLKVPLAVAISTNVEPTLAGTRAAVALARQLMALGKPASGTAAEFRVETEQLGDPAGEYSGDELAPYGTLRLASAGSRVPGAPLPRSLKASHLGKCASTAATSD